MDLDHGMALEESCRFRWKCKGPSRALKCGPCMWSKVSCVDHRIIEGKGEVDCISAGLNDVDLWVSVWSKVDECIDEGIVTSMKAHTTLEE